MRWERASRTEFPKARPKATNFVRHLCGDLGSGIFFLQDGRTSDLVQAILEHRGTKSEANEVIRQYMRLSEKEKQDLLNFLRSL